MHFIVSLFRSGGALRQIISVLASTVVLALLIGSLILVFYITHRGNTGFQIPQPSGFTGVDEHTCTHAPGASTLYAGSTAHMDQAGLYVSSGESLYRLALKNGSLQPVWRYKLDTCQVLHQTPEPGLNNEGIVYPSVDNVIVAGGMAYFSGRDLSGSYLYALRASDGTLSWRKMMSDSGGWGGKLLFLNGLLYTRTSANGNENAILAIDGRSGSQRWSYRYPLSETDQAPGLETVGDGKIYVSTNNRLFALDAASGRQVWSTQVEGQQTFVATRFFDGVVYATSSATCFNCAVEQSSSLAYAFDPTSGKQFWQSEKVAGYLSPPAEVRGVVYFGSQDGSVYALHAKNGTRIWKASVGGEVRTLPQVSNGVLYVGAGHFQDVPDLNNGHITALDAMRGNKLWSYVPTGVYDGYTGICVGNGDVYVAGGSESPSVAIDIVHARDGVLLQQYKLQVDYARSSFNQILVS